MVKKICLVRKTDLENTILRRTKQILFGKPDLGEKMFAGRNGKVIILLVWIYANLLMVPMYTEIDPKVRILHFFMYL